MDNMFNTDSGLRPPSPLTFSSAPGQGLFGDSLGYEDFRFPNQDFINMPVSPGQSAPAQQPPPPPNMMMMAPNDPSMQLFNPSEQRYFSEFLDTLVVDQDFTFDPSAIPNLPNLSLFSHDALPAGFNLENTQSTNNPYMLPANTASSSSSAAQQLQQQLYPHQHPMGTTTVQGAMDYDMSSGFKTNEQQESAYGSQSVPAKRTKTNKANGAGSEALALDATHSQDAAAASKQLSKLSLDNPHHTNGHHHPGTLTTTPAAKRPSKAKKNKREEADKYAQASGHRNHRGSSSSASSRSRSHSQSQSRAQPKEEESGHEQHDSVSDDYASDAPAQKSNNNNNNNNNNGNSNGTPKGATHESSSSSPTSAGATAATTKRKPYKELLTEEEKRANHIASEQKRRNTIRNGFKDMTDIIPDLKDVNSSKSTILFKAVDFIKYLERRNQILQEKAQLLETRLSMQKGTHSYQHQHQHQHQHNSTSQHPSPPQQQQHSQQHSQQPYHQHSYPHQHQQQSYQNQQLAAYNGAGLDDKRLQDIPNIYPVGLTR
ncbi:hypothetical protein BGZ70_007006 [Mortierella alpina]|uniref:BHLH domain-containing protein n=1 Tax=Mortierella alpina TaxID=64518 RepID=A0A9P6M3B7_MORAP|nr:hypothetical protein BGZ70_007006 [Mortierella alpina]